MSDGYIRQNNKSKSYVLKNELKNRAMCDIRDNDTRRSYRQSINVFMNYAKENQIRDISKITVKELNEYSQYLMDRGYTPATVHTRLAPICKALRIDMREVEHPRREITKIIRGRGGSVGDRGRREETQERFAHLVQGQRAIGIRRAELQRLTKEDLVTDESGYLCVHVKRGKGGKEQLQRILPQYEASVKRLFDSVEPGQSVFDPVEFANHINLHGMRAAVAQDAYEYYTNRLITEPGYRDQLMDEMIQRFKAFHRGTPDQFIADILRGEGEYELRGPSKKLAEENGRPVVYNRMALMAVSVFHLSHWRINVSVTNYMLAVVKEES